jgi:hypothetical protein
MEQGKRKKDRWDKADILLRATIGLLTPLVIAAIGYMLNSSLRRAEAEAANLRLYSQLMSSREQADSGLRKDVLMSTMQSFLAAEETDIESKLLRLELLATNFHDSLNLKPLFLHLDRLLTLPPREDGAGEAQTSEQPPSDETQKKRERLEKMAREVARKQTIVLEAVGMTWDADLWADPEADPPRKKVPLDGVEREFQLELVNIDPRTREVEIRVSIFTHDESEQENKGIAMAQFTVGFFDFPMIDNLRLSRDQRLAVVLKGLIADEKPAVANLQMLYFPGRYACLREKPYFQDVIENLRRLQ